ncbi:MAG: 50S ribosomal protein L10 [bacterium]
MGAIEARANAAKKEAVAVLEEKIGRAQGLYFTDFSGLTVAQINELRGRFFETGNSEFVVAKNTLINIALHNKGIENVSAEALEGSTAMAIGYEDPVIPAKVVAEFAKKNEKKRPLFKGGFVDGVFYDSEKVKVITELPPIEQIYASIVGSIQAPLANFVGVLHEILRSFVGVIDAIIQKKQAAGEE